MYGPESIPIEQISSGGTVTYLHHDQQGSTRLLTGSTGTVTGKCTYSAYMRNRVYDPATAQFLTVDPAESITQALTTTLSITRSTTLTRAGLRRSRSPPRPWQAPAPSRQRRAPQQYSAALTSISVSKCSIHGPAAKKAMKAKPSSSNKQKQASKRARKSADRNLREICHTVVSQIARLRLTVAMGLGKSATMVRTVCRLGTSTSGTITASEILTHNDWPEGVRGLGRPMGPNE